MSADAEYKPDSAEYDDSKGGSNSTKDDYKSSAQKGDDAVVSDSAKVEDPIDGKTADSDEQLVKDDSDAIDESNIIDERTRGAAPEGGYKEPGDDEGLPR